jgi:hypothetical protein
MGRPTRNLKLLTGSSKRFRGSASRCRTIVSVQIRIDGYDLPGSSCGPSLDEPGGYHRIEVGVQRRNKPTEWLGRVRGDAASATWTLDCDVVETATGVDLKGPYIQGSSGRRFIYLSWGTVDAANTFTMFRRAKLWLDAIPAATLAAAVTQGVLVGRLGLTDRKGNPLCAAVRPPVIDWTAEAA